MLRIIQGRLATYIEGKYQKSKLALEKAEGREIRLQI
jgi:hypothetical protein